MVFGLSLTDVLESLLITLTWIIEQSKNTLKIVIFTILQSKERLGLNQSIRPLKMKREKTKHLEGLCCTVFEHLFQQAKPQLISLGVSFIKWETISIFFPQVV